MPTIRYEAMTEREGRNNWKLFGITWAVMLLFAAPLVALVWIGGPPRGDWQHDWHGVLCSLLLGCALVSSFGLVYCCVRWWGDAVARNPQQEDDPVVIGYVLFVIGVGPALTGVVLLVVTCYFVAWTLPTKGWPKAPPEAPPRVEAAPKPDPASFAWQRQQGCP